MKQLVSSTALAIALATPLSAQTNNSACQVDKRFFLTGEIVGIGKGLCIAHDRIAPGANAATLTFERDGVEKDSDGEIFGTIAWRALPVTAAGNWSYTGFLYATADGHFDAEDGTNELRYGFALEAAQKAGPLNMSYSLAAYEISDFDGNASGYGVSGSVIPVLNTEPIGVNYRGVDGSTYYIARGDIDALSISDAGDTGYVDDTEYTFISATLGIGYILAGQYDFSLTHQIGRNMIGEYNYNSTIGSLKIPMSKDQNVGLVMSFEKSKDRVTLEDKEESSISISFSF